MADGPDHELLLGVLDRHPGAAGKIGPGVAAFRVECSLSGRGLRALVERVDGTFVEFSYLKAIGVSRDDLVVAMRRTVDPQGARARTEAVTCRACGEPLAEGDGPTQVHHAGRSFENLREGFLRRWRGGGRRVPTRFIRAPGYGADFRARDEAFARAWRDFHQDRAVLEVLCGRCHAAVHGKRRGP